MRLFLSIFFMSFSLALSAQKVYTVDDVPNSRQRDRYDAVSNPDRILNATTVSKINDILIPLQQATSIEVQVVAITSIGDASPEDFSYKLFRKWGIGKDQDNNGLLILLVTNERYIRFEVGYGLEGVLTDAISKTIQVQEMVPYFADGDWNNGILQGVRIVSEYLKNPEGGLNLRPDAMAGSDAGFYGRLLFMFGCLVLIILIALFSSRRNRKCPRCGAVMRVDSRKTTKINKSTAVESTVLVCPKCDYRTTRNRTHNISTSSGPVIIGGGMGGLGGGRGPVGGGFGGGRSGGGGATTRF